MNFFYAWLNNRTFRQLGIIAGLLGLVIGFLWLGASWTDWVPGFPGDDGLVYAAISRNLADGFGYGLNPGANEGFADGPLWARIGGWAQLLGLKPWFASVFCGLVAWVLLLWVVVRVCRRVGERRNFGWLAATLLMVHPWTGGLWVRGEEQILAGALMMAAVWLQYRRPDPPPQRSAWSATFLAALAVTLRPELWPIPLLLIIDDLVRKYTVPRKPNWVFSLMPRLAVHLLLFLGPVALYSVFHFLNSRHPVPVSLSSRFNGPGVPALVMGTVEIHRWGEVLLVGMLFPLYAMTGLVLSAPMLVPLFAGGLVQFMRKRDSIFPLLALLLPLVIQGWLYPWGENVGTGAWLRFGGVPAAFFLMMGGLGVCRLFPMRLQRRKWFDRTIYATMTACLVVFLAEVVFRFFRWRPEGLALWNPMPGMSPAGVPLWLMGGAILVAAASSWWAMGRTGTTRLVQSMLMLGAMVWTMAFSLGFGIPAHRAAVAELTRGPRLAGGFIAWNIEDILRTAAEVRPTIATDTPGCISFDADLPVMDLRPHLRTQEKAQQWIERVRRLGERGPALLFYDGLRYPWLEELLEAEVETRRVSGLPDTAVEAGWVLLRLQQWQPHRTIDDRSIGILEDTGGLLVP